MIKIAFIGIIFFKTLFSVSSFETAWVDEPWQDATQQPTEPKKPYEYREDLHKIWTPDGYLLAIHRIVSQDGFPAEGRPVVLLLHGLVCTSKIYLTVDEKKSLGILLSREGYDVWLPDFRGHDLSIQHQTLSYKDPKYWDFSSDELIKYDLPTIIDYVLNVSKQQTLTAIGQSLGATNLFCLLAEQQEYNDKINLFISIGSAGFSGNSTSIGARFLEKVLLQTNLHNYINMQSVGNDNTVIPLMKIFCSIPESPFTKFILDSITAITGIGQTICSNIFLLTYGFSDGESDEQVLLDSIMFKGQGEISSISNRTVYHYMQQSSSGKMQRYDFGRDGNVLHYNTSTPPEYNLGNVRTPMIIFKCDNDAFLDEADLEKLIAVLPENIKPVIVRFKNCNHSDYMTGKTIPIRLAKIISSIMKERNPISMVEL